MMNVTITKDFGTGKANAQAKATLTEIITKALVEAFGEENVAMIRTGGTSQVNEIGVRMGTIIDAGGFSYDFSSFKTTLGDHARQDLMFGLGFIYYFEGLRIQ